ncbi:Asp/Glu/hydantoin racemase [Rhizobium sp. Root708]|uniref:aspartate/glutamate racemase family protein n=1 Tax=Rhizobium sp. Root708 TaxID=1736592 RepID=UPI0006F5518F|nr:aspartate/glutamate racemase family protein [Rhizobium sp. Root708]KRB60008.1 Asp/Glu/hydantoin racemase [Rhizobium sp. Root708]
MTRILLFNPNTSSDVTDLLVRVAGPSLSPTSELLPVTAPRGVPYIATRAEAAIASGIVLDVLAEREGSFDVAIVAAFGDPGLGGARELMSVPVIGLAEAAMLSACMLGQRFSIVSFARALGPWFRECVVMHGLLNRLASIRLLDAKFASLASVQDEKEELLVQLALSAVEEDGADVIILAGAPLAGLAARVRERIPVPVVESVVAAVKQAELLAALNPKMASAGTFRRPDPKSSHGLSPALERLLMARPAEARS